MTRDDSLPQNQQAVPETASSEASCLEVEMPDNVEPDTGEKVEAGLTTETRKEPGIAAKPRRRV